MWKPSIWSLSCSFNLILWNCECNLSQKQCHEYEAGLKSRSLSATSKCNFVHSCDRGQPAGDDDWPVQADPAERGPVGSLQRPGPQLPESHPRRQHQLRGVRAPEESAGRDVALNLNCHVTWKLQCDPLTSTPLLPCSLPGLTLGIPGTPFYSVGPPPKGGSIFSNLILWMSADVRRGKADVEGMDSVSSECHNRDCCYLCFLREAVRVDGWLNVHRGPNVFVCSVLWHCKLRSGGLCVWSA